MGLALLIVSVILFVGSLGYLIYRSVLLCRAKYSSEKNILELKKLLPFIASFIVGLTLLFPSILLFWGVEATAYQWSMATVGGFLFSTSVILELLCFIFHYYKKDLSEKLHKIMFTTLMITVVTTVLTFFLTTEGFADFLNLNRPLANCISFTKGLVFTKEGGGITFYALFIISGAVFVYFLADHKMYLQYGKHGLLESTFLVAFPAGIIGARIFYVVGEWQKFVGKEWWEVFAIWKGGLTILGGAVMGITVGVLWYKWRHKQMSVLVAVDICAPVILIAQAIGRWGNFFNCEVYGGLVSDEYWRWLPKIIWNNMHFNKSGMYTGDGMMLTPLFFIEGLVNIFGYAVLAHLFGNRLKKYLEGGDLAYGYLIWYGLTRTFLEPLRDPEFIMGEKGFWSWIWAIVFVAVGVLLVAGNHFVRYLIRCKKNIVNDKHNCISSIIGISIVALVSTGLLISGIILLSTNTFVQTLALNGFNIGLICLIIGISCYALTLIPLSNILELKKAQREG